MLREKTRVAKFPSTSRLNRRRNTKTLFNKISSENNINLETETANTNEDQLKSKLENEKLNLEIEGLKAKLNGQEKLPRWERYRTIFTWLGIVAPIVVSALTFTYQYSYQKEKDRESLNYQQEKDRETLNYQQEKDRESRNYQLEKDREERDRLAKEETKNKQKEQRELRQQQEAKLKQEAKDREAAIRQRTLDLRQLEAEAINLREKGKTQALALLNTGSRASGVSQLSMFGEEALPAILGQILMEPSHSDWENISLSALAGVKRIGVEKLKPSDIGFLEAHVETAFSKAHLFHNKQRTEGFKTEVEIKKLLGIVCSIKEITGMRERWLKEFKFVQQSYNFECFSQTSLN